MPFDVRFRRRLRWARLRRWEFWPWPLFYAPVVLYWLYLSVRARSLTFFTAANPGMTNGGFVAYSKWAVLQHFPTHLRPRTFAFRADRFSADELLVQMSRRDFSFPIVLKPDVGERGEGVARVGDVAALRTYLDRLGGATHTLLMQSFVDLPLEFGVMYHRTPGATRGHVTSVVRKETLHVRGDGRRTLGELVRNHPRAWLYHDLFRRAHRERWDEVPTTGARWPLGDLGNHCRGATFFDAGALISPELEGSFDRISGDVPGFHFGRYDVMAASEAALCAGQVQVLELNGANSEPAHIYDPDMPLLSAYRHLFGHWRRLYHIARANHRRGIPYVPALLLVRRLRAHFRGERPATPSEAAPAVRSA
ncbi:MAG: hypothetical protein WBA12_16025 [Catalinimonas sp.]